MIVSMNRGYYEKGIYQFNRTKIITNYFSENFFSDLLNNISLIFLDTPYSYITILFFYKIITLFGIMKKLEETFDLSWRSKNWIKLFKLMFNMLFISHIFACVWLLEATIYQNDESNGQENWMVFNDLY
jgi:hypothetical protein